MVHNVEMCEHLRTFFTYKHKSQTVDLINFKHDDDPFKDVSERYLGKDTYLYNKHDFDRFNPTGVSDVSLVPYNQFALRLVEMKYNASPNDMVYFPEEYFVHFYENLYKTAIILNDELDITYCLNPKII